MEQIHGAPIIMYAGKPIDQDCVQFIYLYLLITGMK